MAHQIVEIRVNGARGKVLVQEHMPAYYPNLYVTLEQSGRALNTKQKYLEHIGVVEDFLEYESIDLIARLAERPQSRYLTDSEISRFVADAALYKSILDKKYSGVRLAPRDYKTVGRVHAQQRIESVRDYLKFLYEKLGDEATRYAALDDVERRLNRKIKAAKPAWKKARNDDMKGLTNQERNRLVEIMRPQSAENPFANDALQLRNYIILLLGLDLGLRRSEMLLIKLGDIRWHSRELSVVDLEREEIDPRALAPQFKTHERMLEMGDDLIFALKKYVETCRIVKKGPSEVKNHPFLLVSHRRNEGSPLSIKALDGILPRVGKVAPELAHVHPHVLRHDAVYTLLESMREELEKLSPEDRTTKTQKILTYAFGWSPESNMPNLYGAKFWKEEANNAMKKRSDKFKALRESVEAEVRKRHAQ
ncbi:tyrosine-type recombinase/integrase [Pseudomonas congelans]|uniref:site-specific integrase n=1 Tax=Pseudomonas congelans TaxID=200452 RepID=UPI001F2438AC|nr:site-specific integrase [Pseudomonas congelans]MCF5166398.1 tyrosine-type recombinase/integrase [Pseudomonas congelans]